MNVFKVFETLPFADYVESNGKKAKESNMLYENHLKLLIAQLEEVHLFAIQVFEDVNESLNLSTVRVQKLQTRTEYISNLKDEVMKRQKNNTTNTLVTIQQLKFDDTVNLGLLDRDNIFIKDLKSKCPPLPNLEIFDQFRTDGLRTLELYSNPAFFIEEWKNFMNSESEIKRKKRGKKAKDLGNDNQRETSKQSDATQSVAVLVSEKVTTQLPEASTESIQIPSVANEQQDSPRSLNLADQLRMKTGTLRKVQKPTVKLYIDEPINIVSKPAVEEVPQSIAKVEESPAARKIKMQQTYHQAEEKRVSSFPDPTKPLSLAEQLARKSGTLRRVKTESSDNLDAFSQKLSFVENATNIPGPLNIQVNRESTLSEASTLPPSASETVVQESSPNDLFSGIRGGTVKLKKVVTNSNLQTPVKSLDSRNVLLNTIRSGTTKLKKVESFLGSPVSKKPAMHQEVASILSRRMAMETSDEEDDDDDWN